MRVAFASSLHTPPAFLPRRGPAARAACMALLVGLGLALPATAEDTPSVVQIGRTFRPGEIALERGQSLTFSNRDDFIHQIYVKSDAMNFDSDEQPPGETISLTFAVPGTFEVRCHIHPKMSLIVHVR